MTSLLPHNPTFITDADADVYTESIARTDVDAEAYTIFHVLPPTQFELAKLTAALSESALYLEKHHARHLTNSTHVLGVRFANAVPFDVAVSTPPS